VLKKYLNKLLITDFICLVYCVFQIIYVASLGFKLADQTLVIFVYLSCACFSLICLAIRHKYKNSAVQMIFSLYPVILFIPLYMISGHEIPMFFNHFFDSKIINLELAIFGVHPTIWFQQFKNPLLTEWMMFGYSFYLMLIPITTGWLYYSGKKEESEHTLASLMISFYICYILFSLIPVAGPRLAMADLYTVKFHGYIFKAITEAMEAGPMLHGGAFPSAHCSAATVMLLLSYKYDKKLFWWVMPVIITLYISTVYGRYHYPTDVLAGMIVGISGIKLYHPIKRWWVRKVLN
jgi:membrane-associated phospholipid phosphatase